MLGMDILRRNSTRKKTGPFWTFFVLIWQHGKAVKRGDGMARQKKCIGEMVKIIEEYTDKTDIPILKEVCYINKWNHVQVSEMAADRNNKNLMDAIKRMQDKKESNLEKGMLTGKYGITGAVFCLKQLGWRDRPEADGADDAERLKALKNMFEGVKDGGR